MKKNIVIIIISSLVIMGIGAALLSQNDTTEINLTGSEVVRFIKIAEEPTPRSIKFIINTHDSVNEYGWINGQYINYSDSENIININENYSITYETNNNRNIICHISQ